MNDAITQGPLFDTTVCGRLIGVNLLTSNTDNHVQTGYPKVLRLVHGVPSRSTACGIMDPRQALYL